MPKGVERRFKFLTKDIFSLILKLPIFDPCIAKVWRNFQEFIYINSAPV